MDGTISKIQSNINAATENKAKIEDLQAKTDVLSDAALQFNNKARDTRKSMMWKNIKMRICIIVGIIILLIVIIVPSGTLAPKILTILSLTRASCRFKKYLIIITIVVITLESGDILVSSESLGGQSSTSS
jgi:vesicle-associated membrane protein 4